VSLLVPGYMFAEFVSQGPNIFEKLPKPEHSHLDPGKIQAS
jgi:hypothetical protein